MLVDVADHRTWQRTAVVVDFEHPAIPETEHHLNDADLSLLFGGTAARELSRESGFPPASGGRTHRTWPAHAVFTWAAHSGDASLAARVPIRFQPIPDRPAEFCGTDSSDSGRAVCLNWRTPAGVVQLVYATGDIYNAGLTHVHIDPHDDAYAIVAVTTWINPYIDELPELKIRYPAMSTETRSWWNLTFPARITGATWRDLARLLGQPMPYWVEGLRDAQRMLAWHPGAAPTTGQATVADHSVTPLLVTASFEPEQDGLVATTLRDLALSRQGHANQHAENALNKILALNPPTNVLTIAARPATQPRRNWGERRVPPAQRRAAWLALFAREDELAATCVTTAELLDMGEDFPCTHVHPVKLTRATEGTVVTEWLDRLRPCAPTAGHDWLQLRNPTGRRTLDTEIRYLQDPVTEAPVLDILIHGPANDTRRSVHVAVPNRITNPGLLAEVILDDTAWVRASDGQLYIMPIPAGTTALAWGYHGHGPGALAATTAALMNDLTSAPTRDPEPRGLTLLFATPVAQGTCYTRRDLEDALHIT